MKNQYTQLYNVWAKWSNRSPEEQRIMKAAGKHNCSMLDGHGIATSCVSTEFLFGIRYRLNANYVIPEEPKKGRFLYSLYSYQCPYCLRHHESNVDPEELDRCNNVREECDHCDSTFVLSNE